MFKKLSVQTKILAAAGLMLTLMLLVAVLAIAKLGAVHTIAHGMYADRVVPLRDVGSMRAELGNVDTQLQRAIHDPVRAHQRAYAAGAQADAAEIERLVRAYRTTADTGAERRELAQFAASWKPLRAAARSM